MQHRERIFLLLGLAPFLLLGGLAAFGSLHQSPPPPPSPADWKSRGSPDAPVVIQEYGDFQCPACQSFQARVLPTIIKE